MRHLALLLLIPGVALGQASPLPDNGGTSPFRLPDGSASAPALTFTSDPDTGLYRAGSNDVRMQVDGTQAQKWTTSGVEFPGTIASSVGSGSNAVSLSTNGARVDFGSGSNDYLASNGTSIVSANGLVAIGPAYASAAIDVSSLAPGQCEDNAMTLTGAAVNDPLACSFPAGLEIELTVSCRVSATNTVTFRTCNVNALNTVDPASATYGARAFK